MKSVTLSFPRFEDFLGRSCGRFAGPLYVRVIEMNRSSVACWENYNDITAIFLSRKVVEEEISAMDLRKVSDEEKVNLCRKYTIHIFNYY